MAENMSLADQAIEALAMVKAMDDSMSMEHPHRHSVRNLRRTAEDILRHAFRQAVDLAYQAQDLGPLVDNVRAEKR